MVATLVLENDGDGWHLAVPLAGGLSPAVRHWHQPARSEPLSCGHCSLCAWGLPFPCSLGGQGKLGSWIQLQHERGAPHQQTVPRHQQGILEFNSALTFSTLEGWGQECCIRSYRLRAQSNETALPTPTLTHQL